MCFPDLTMCPAMNGKNPSQYMYMVWAFFFQNISNHIHVITVGMTPPSPLSVKYKENCPSLV